MVGGEGAVRSRIHDPHQIAAQLWGWLEEAWPVIARKPLQCGTTPNERRLATPKKTHGRSSKSGSKQSRVTFEHAGAAQLAAKQC